MAAITTIQPTDILSASRTTINDNFAALNAESATKITTPDTTGAASKFLRRNAANTGWEFASTWSVDWTNILNVPATFPPSSHSHTIAEITSLQTTLDAKEAKLTAGLTTQYYRGDKTWQALNAAAISGLSPSATTDTTNASNIVSGSLALARLAQGAATLNQVLQWNGTAWTPATVAGGGGGGTGDVVGPATATHNAIALFDGTTGKLLKNSTVKIDANNDLTLGRYIYFPNSAGDIKNQFRMVGSTDSLYIIASSAAGATVGAGITFRTSLAGAGEVDRLHVSESGSLRLYATTATPTGMGVGSSGDMYVKGGKLIFAYNDGGTIRYKYLDLAGTGVTWTHATTAP